MKPKNIFSTISLMCILLLTSCSSKPVQHLASDVCLLSPGISSQEVITYMGIPNQRRLNEEGLETWLYFQVNKSFLRKTPYIGDRLGQQDYDMVTVTFLNDAVSTCVYRSYTEEQIKKMGLVIQNEK